MSSIGQSHQRRAGILGTLAILATGVLRLVDTVLPRLGKAVLDVDDLSEHMKRDLGLADGRFSDAALRKASVRPLPDLPASRTWSN